MEGTARRGTRTAGSAASRSLLASGAFHATLIGAGVLWGVLAPGGRPSEPRNHVARFAPPEAERVPEERERLDLVEPPDPSEPELRESEVWALPTVESASEDASAPERAATLDWVDSRPLEIGTLGTEEPAVAAAVPAEPVTLERQAYVVAPKATPFVAEPVPRLVPAPPYPRLSRRAGEEGSVLCRLQLDATGQVLEVVVVESSGFERLDQAAVETLAGWSFEPRREDGRAVAASLLHRVTFRLGSS